MYQHDETPPTPAAPSPDGGAPQDAGLHYLLRRLTVIERRVHRVVASRFGSEDDPAPAPLRTPYLTDEAAAWLCLNAPAPLEEDPAEADWLAQTEHTAQQAYEAGQRIPLRELAADFGLSAFDVDVLLTALLPEVDSRFERLYAYLQDDPLRPYASCGLALEVCALPAHDPRARSRLFHGPLMSQGLLTGESAVRPALTRSLRVPDRIVAHLLGQPWTRHPPGISLADRAGPLPPSLQPLADHLMRLLNPERPLYLQASADSAAQSAAEAALAATATTWVYLDPRTAAGPHALHTPTQHALLEARLRRCPLLIGPLPAPAADRDDENTDTPASGPFTPLTGAQVPVLILGTGPWHAPWSRHLPLQTLCPPATAADRTALWEQQLGPDTDPATRQVLTSAMHPYRLAPAEVSAAAGAARAQAAADGTALAPRHLQAAARRLRTTGLDRLARHIEPAAAWSDLILPGPVTGQLHDLAARARYREQVLGQWRLHPGAGRGTGTAALFTGDSGTGKTLAAEVIATDLGLDLYVINLATVVDKYIGETEKNLDRIFTQAEGVDAVLLFDEADAVFGRRSETTSAHDRYANIETAYLLQRLEAFDGIALLTTNLSANIDEAFTRRLDHIIHFPLPEAADRRRLWETCLGTTAPRTPGLPLDTLAASYDLSGGSIRNCAITAAYRAAATNRPISAEDLRAAVATEYRKLGRLFRPTP
ncbi:ATP-binding protein [Streptomyces sp. MNP-20]|uniref:ATP-binding protein n=1 Tax=Streptomyces sp. MNP-20 TaxID=2721165 RepID=UPI0015545209|nr:ATP-binding protein [Streptomyces sp. MNP-20]